MPDIAPKATALVLAGRRDGALDPLAAAAGVDDKCLVPVAGRPMILHVLDALAEAPEIGRIVVSLNDPAMLDGLVELRRLRDEGRLFTVAACPNLVDSVLAAIEGAPFPVLVTTADNVLLTAESVAAMCDKARADSADVAAAFARRGSVLAAHPEGQRRFYRFRDDSYSNCNAYWIGNADALSVTELFRGGGQFAKHPMRIVKAFGLLNLIRFRYGIGTLGDAFSRFSRRFGLTMRAIILDDGRTAIDVDNERTLAIAEQLLGERSEMPPRREARTR